MKGEQICQISAATGEVFVVSDCDYDRVMQHEWRMWAYLFCVKLKLCLHHFIIGPRPADVPEDYVVDHANRNPLDARRENLRFVSVQFKENCKPLLCQQQCKDNM